MASSRDTTRARVATLCLFLCVFLARLGLCFASKVYVVYMGSRGGDGPEQILRQNHQILTDIHGGRAEQAKESHVYSYRHGFRGFAAKLTKNQASEIAKMPGVVSVFPNQKRRLHTTHSWDFMGLLGEETMEIPGFSTKNQVNVIMGFIDTGIWPESPSFSDARMPPVPSRWKGQCQPGVAFNASICNRKIIGARYYLSGYEAEEEPAKTVSFKSARDSSGHGTHTASIAAGRYVTNMNYDGLAAGAARGGAPMARIAIYKTCWDSGCYDVDLLAAFDDAIRDGAFPFFFGGGLGFYRYDWRRMAPIGKTKLDSGWLAARSTEIDLTGIQLTTTHPPSGPDLPWMEAVVPGTVLATLVKNKLVPDPFYGLENESIIDIADSGREHYTFWFFTTFQCKLSGNQHVDINFRAINYSAEVYLNGHKRILPKGMFRRHSLDVTDILHPDGENLLAVLVHPPDHPGRIPPEGGQGGDHEIGKDVATQYVEGWDWIIPIRDRNTGIWDEVSIYVTGPVKIVDPHLVSSLFDNYKRVYLHTTTELVNRSAWVAECSLNVQVTTELEGSIFLVEHLHTEHVSISPGASVQYTFPQLFFYKPNLWWPNGMGKQSLYDVAISLDVKGFGESDSWSHHFGFRKIESHIDSVTGGRLFKVNGQPVFIRGGNWILSDGLLRLSKKRYKTDIKFHADMNLNMIRCWGGGLAERPEFYHYCDIYGLLVWQEFWITGDCDGRGVPISNPDGPLDHELFLLCARDTVKLLRNHPSLALWVGGNEQVPPKDINRALKNDLKLHPFFENSTENGNVKEEIFPVLKGANITAEPKDPSQYLDGTRIYIQGSMWDGFANGKGDFTDGPYEIQYPESFFEDEFYKYGFNPEVGSVGIPVAATIRATMPPVGWQIPLFKKVDNGYVEEVPNPTWQYHKYIPYSKPGKVHDQILMYGTPMDLDDFCLKAQLVNYVQYRSLLEGWTSRMWSKYTGVLIWKNQNPWTGLRGQFYDHLHDQTAGFYGCRSAAEPIHVQLNLATYFIEAVNTTSEELSDVAIEVSVWDLEGACPYYKVYEKLSVPSKKTVPIFELKYPKSKNAKPVYFLLLKLYTMSDYGILSRNFYWLHLSGGDYKLLEPYRKKKIPLKITSQAFIRGSTYEIRMHLQNKSKKPGSKNLLYKNICTGRNGEGDCDMASLEPVHRKIEQKQEGGLIQSICKSFSRETNGLRVAEINGTDVGVAFFLHFSVHASKKEHKEGEDTRILPVHYSNNYFSLVPGEEMPITLSFEVPPGVTPRVTLNGWNYHSGHHIY